MALSCVHNSRAQENYQINKAKDTIFVSDDCTIEVSKFAPEETDIYGIGEKGGDGGYFKSKTESLNGTHKGITYGKNDGIAVINVKFRDWILVRL